MLFRSLSAPRPDSSDEVSDPELEVSEDDEERGESDPELLLDDESEGGTPPLAAADLNQPLPGTWDASRPNRVVGDTRGVLVLPDTLPKPDPWPRTPPAKRLRNSRCSDERSTPLRLSDAV